MIAAMISKVIGLLYKSPLSSIVGNMGMGYISLAQNAYMILLMIASFSIPQAVSKLISERVALRDYKNAQKIFRGAMIYNRYTYRVVSSGMSVRREVDHSQQPAECGPCASDPFPYDFSFRYPGRIQRIFPGISEYAAYLGVPDPGTDLNAAVSLLAAWLFIRYLSDGTAGQNAKWGAAGSTVGTTAGVVVALLFMLLVYG